MDLHRLTADELGVPATSWLTKLEAAEYLRVRPRTIDRWVAEGRLTRYKLKGLQSVRFDRAELDRMIQPAGE